MEKHAEVEKERVCRNVNYYYYYYYYYYLLARERERERVFRFAGSTRPREGNIVMGSFTSGVNCMARAWGCR
jgi:hypothetical protein